MRAVVVSLAALTAASVLACKSTQKTPTPTPTPAPTTAQAPAPGGPAGPNRVRLSPTQMDSARHVTITKLLSEIAGRENEPAEKVFKNVKLWKTVPARSLLDRMNSYGRALGNVCTGCHIADKWDVDTRKNKVISRQMQQMVNDLNVTYLPKVPELDEDHPPVTCAMCHQGSGHPKKDFALTPNAMPPAGPPGGAPGRRPPLD